MPVAVAAALLLWPALAPAQEPPMAASFTAVDGPPRAFVAGPGGNSVTISPGGTVMFAYPGGNQRHNVAFTGMQPSSCQQTAGTPAGQVPPLPTTPSPPVWEGTCTFSNPAVYSFVCQAHAEMTGTITVQGPATAPPPPPPPGTTPPPPPPPAAAPMGPAASSLRLAAAQRGSTVRGSLLVARPGSRLDVQALARRASVSRSRRAGSVRVGRVVRSSVGAGRVSFAVRLNAIARRAVARRGRLRLAVRIRVTPPTGAAFSTTRSVTMRAPRVSRLT